MDGIVKLIQKNSGRLIFSLLSGIAYFIVLLKLLTLYSSQQNGLILIFFLPAIICGAALVLFKSFTNMLESDNLKGVKTMFIMHVILIIIAVVFAFTL